MKIYKIFFCLILFFTSSCITKSLWSGKIYDESINQFLIGEDGRYIVMIGGQYHYVFADESRVLSRIVLLKQKGIITIDYKKTLLKLDKNNEIKGYLILEGQFSNLPIEDIGVLTSMGFRADDHDNISIKVELSGRRYLARSLGQALTQSNTTLTIPITYDDSSAAKDIGKIAITPITVGLDAVLLIGKIVVYPLSF